MLRPVLLGLMPILLAAQTPRLQLRWSCDATAWTVWPKRWRGRYAPALFIIAATGETIVVRFADGALITADNPARPGDVLIVFLTGAGGLTTRRRRALQPWPPRLCPARRTPTLRPTPNPRTWTTTKRSSTSGASIAEYDGGEPREVAERTALCEVLHTYDRRGLKGQMRCIHSRHLTPDPLGCRAALAYAAWRAVMEPKDEGCDGC